VECGHVDVFGDGQGLGELDSEEAGIAAEGVGSDEHRAQSKQSRFTKGEQDLAGLSIDPRRARFPAHPGQPTPLRRALAQILLKPTRSLDALAELSRIGPEVTIDRVTGEPLHGIPVPSAAAIANDGRAAEVQDRIVLQPRQKVGIGGLDRERQSPRGGHRVVQQKQSLLDKI
jgi:hypothetical protein